MANDELQTYRTGQVGGAATAITLLDGFVRGSETPDERQFFEELKRDIEADRATLVELLHQAGGTTSSLREAGAWVAEKLTDLRLRLMDPSGRRMSLLEALELLAVGIFGKRLLWQALGASADRVPVLRPTDFARLERRAQDQLERVDERRIAVARRVFGTAADSGRAPLTR